MINTITGLILFEHNIEAISEIQQRPDATYEYSIFMVSGNKVVQSSDAKNKLHLHEKWKSDVAQMEFYTGNLRFHRLGAEKRN